MIFEKITTLLHYIFLALELGKFLDLKNCRKIRQDIEFEEVKWGTIKKGSKVENLNLSCFGREQRG